MRCLKRTCPMHGRSVCPAISACPEAKKVITVRGLPPNCFNDMSYGLNLSPPELIALVKALTPFLDHADCAKYWPGHIAGTSATVKDITP